MAKIWNNPIDKNVDWGGDKNTDGLPVSGEQVQKFIKDSLNRKAGVFYYDTANNRYLVFADEEERDKYLADPTLTNLILGTFDAPFNYSAEINLATPTYNAVYIGATGNYLDFTFDIKNKQGASTGENVIITYTFIRNAIKQVFTQVARPGEAIHFNVDKYLGEGTNTIIIGVTGQTSLAATTISVTYQVINIQLTDETDISIPYDLSTGAKTMEVGFTVSGAGTKIVEWYLNGVALAEDEIVAVSERRTKYITLSNLQQGRHSLQIRAYTIINGERFYTPTLYRDVIVYTKVNSKVISAIAMEIPSQYGLVTDEPKLYNIIQYVPYTLRFATYSPNNRPNVEVVIKLNNEELGTVSSQNGVENEFAIVSKKSGNMTITLSDDEGGVYTIPASVSSTTMDLEEITEGLELDFLSLSENKKEWSYGDYVGTFDGFNWNATSGWSGKRLKINSGASFSINYAPLANNRNGKTIELEFKTTNVNDDNAIICDLRNENGVGLLLTATKISLISEAGVVMENEFKANEEVRIGVVIHRATGSTRQGMSFFYANGCMSRCEDWETADSFESDKQISFVGSAGAEVELKAIRVYNAALSDEQILNNYILYRDTAKDMMDVYDRNDVYYEGTNTFSPDKMVSRLPVMIVTGDIPVLENTSDKDTQIIVDVEYNNLQDESKSFKMIGAAMRPQGTSSMGYPKKNFRIYTKKVAETILLDAEGKVVEDKLYAFKKGSAPVDCWCLKADYAESSGTHNTGIAKLWNKALYNMQIAGEYVCRTNAQRAALANGYPYDVRTTIDGFPILLFYRKNATDEPIFIGKYNFNNDKSTEKVFGFTDIKGFDNSKMQCWEILNNGNALALFQTMDGFDSNWSEAYESRYPDTKTPYLGDLKAFSEWMVGINGDHARFATEKWNHFRIYNMAAYYCYLMRHAAADQLVKNAMFTSEDGKKWYFIQYDNDTINGLNNMGEIDLLPTDDRNSVDESGAFKFAGHSSVLWNMLEADAEFMQIVKDVDNALYSAGISYNECIKMFDEEQADKWVERVYNQDQEYKYVGPYVNQGINNLEMLQGKRDLHRRWWLSKRFSIYDAKFVSGEYKSNSLEVKCMNDTPSGQQFTIKAGYPLDYGYGINDVPRQTGVTLGVGESYTFTTAEVVNIGDPIRIYGAPNLSEVDFSLMANRLTSIDISRVKTDELGTKLKKLVLGGENVNNVAITEISGLKQATMLTHLDVRGLRGIKSLDLSSQPYFEELKAIGSEVSSVSFTKGAPVNRLEFPSTMKALTLEQLPYLTAENLILENIAGLHTINIKGCPSLTNDFVWIKNWYDSKATVDARCTLIMDNVSWEGVNADDLLNIAKVGSLELKGKVVLTEIDAEQIVALTDIFGEGAFDKDADFYIDAPTAIFVIGRTTIAEGESEQYSVVVFGAKVLSQSWTILSGGNSYVTLDRATGFLTVEDGYGNGTIVIKTIINTDKGLQSVETTITVKAVVYPTSSNTSIKGNSPLEAEYETFSLSYPDSVTGKIFTFWSLEGLDGYAVIESQNGETCVIKKLKEAELSVSGTLTCVVTKKSGAELFTLFKTIEIVNNNIAETDAGICKALYDAGLCNNETYITKEEAALITATDLQPGASGLTSVFYPQRNNIKSFNGFKYFINVTEIKPYCFEFCAMGSIELPNSVKALGDHSFANCTTLANIILPNGLESIGAYCFSACKGFHTINIPYGVTTIGNGAFTMTAITSIVIPESVTNIGFQCFSNCLLLESIVLPKEVNDIGYACFMNCSKLKSLNISHGVKQLLYAFCSGCAALESVTIPDTVVYFDSESFANCKSLKSITIPMGVTSIQSNSFVGCLGMSTIMSLATTAPSVASIFGTVAGNFTGRNTYATGENTLYVPVGASGYDQGYWLDPLQNADKCGFTLSPTL